MASVTQAVNASTIANQTTVAVTISASAAGALIVVGCSCTGTRNVTGVTDNIGNVYTQVPGAAASCNSGLDITDIWMCAAPASGVTTVTVTFSGAAGTHMKDAEVWEIAGFTLAVAETVAAVSSQSQTNNIILGPAVVTGVSGWIAAICRTTAAGGIAANPSAGNEFTSGGDTVSDDCGAVSLISVAGSHQPQWDDNNSFIENCSSAVAFKEYIPPNLRVPLKTFPATIRPAAFAPGLAR